MPVVATWLVLLLFCAYTAADLAILHGQARRQAEALATTYVRLVEQHASSTFDRGNLVLSRAVGLVTAEDTGNARNLDPRRRERLEAALLAVQREGRGVVSMTVTDAEGYAFANTVGVAPGASLADRGYFQQLKAQNSDAPVASQAIYGRLSKRWGVQLARRVAGPGGSFAGMVVANIGLMENFTDFYSGLSLPPDTLVALKDLRHAVMVRHPVREDLFGKTVHLASIDEPIDAGAVESLAATTSPIDGKPRLAALRRLPDYPLYVLVGISDDVYLANWRAARNRAVLAVGMALAGAVFLTLVLRRKADLDAALRISEQNARALIDATTDACILFQSDGTLLGCNKVMAQRIGAEPHELIGGSIWTLFPAAVTERRRRAVEEAVETGLPVALEDDRDGHYLYNTIYPIADASGRVDRVAVFSRDITREREAEQRIQSYLQDIERSNEDLERFAYIASHDLREPLRMVSGYVSMLERRYASRLDQDAREFIAFAADGAKRMDRLILDLLEYSRVKRAGAAMVPVPAGQAVAQALANLETLIDTAQARIEVAPLPVVVADPSQLARLFQNLIGNALKYHAEDRRPEILVTAERQDGFWRFSVRDNGIGIEPDYFEHIFGIFQRLHTRQKYDGTGIGLAICRSIVERHGGRIWVDSAPGEGATFHFTLRAGD